MANELAALLGAALSGPDVPVRGASTASNPRPDTLIFLKDPTPEVIERINAVGSAVVLVPVGTSGAFSVSTVEVDRPRLAFAKVTRAFLDRQTGSGVASTAIVDATAEVGRDVIIGEFSIVGAGVVIGDRTEIRHHVVVGSGTRLGRNCLLKSHAVIGEEGFGFEVDDDGRPLRLAHLGGVEIGDGVEIGSFTSVMRGTIDSTVIESDAKIDDQVTIGHNAHVRERALVIAGTVIGGSARIGRSAWISPNVSILNGIEIGDGAKIGIGSVVTKSVPPGVVAVGNPARVMGDRE